MTDTRGERNQQFLTHLEEYFHEKSWTNFVVYFHHHGEEQAILKNTCCLLQQEKYLKTWLEDVRSICKRLENEGCIVRFKDCNNNACFLLRGYFQSEKIGYLCMGSLQLDKVQEKNIVEEIETICQIFKEKLPHFKAGIECFFTEKISLNPTPLDLAEHFSISGRELRTLLKEQGLLNFQDLKNDFRLRHAKKYLMKSESITSIAEYLGFLSIHSFSKFFKKQTGISPTQWLEKKEREMKIS